MDLAVLPALEGLLPRFNDEDIIDGNDIDSHNALVGEFGVVGDVTRDLRGAGCYNTIKWISTCEKGGGICGWGVTCECARNTEEDEFSAGREGDGVLGGGFPQRLWGRGELGADGDGHCDLVELIGLQLIGNGEMNDEGRAEESNFKSGGVRCRNGSARGKSVRRGCQSRSATDSSKTWNRYALLTSRSPNVVAHRQKGERFYHAFTCRLNLFLGQSRETCLP